jgi:hypothetical protein
MSGRSRSLMPGDPKAGNSLRHKGMHVAIGPMRRAEIERVTGIEPAWPAWKARRRCVRECPKVPLTCANTVRS